MNRRRQDVATVRISDEEYSRLESKFEALKNEFTACRRKLDSKCEALLILSKELDQCRSERDQFKLMAEQLRERCQTLKTRSLSGKPKQSTSDTGIYKNYTDTQSQNLARLLYESKEYSKSLQFEVDDLKQKLHDANGDIKLLREQIARSRVGTTDEGLSTRHFPAHEREELVQKLESSNEQYLQLERDLQTVLDEKEELVTERDVYKTKYERLNQELNYILKGHEDRVVDIDALIMDNRYLKDRLKQMEDEKRMTMAAVSKYKRILEKKKSKSSMKFGQNRGGGMVITEKQIQEVLQSQSVLGTPQAVSDWQALAASLLESVNDKKLALYHQRKTNKILGNRVAELEKKIKTLECAGLWSIPGNISSSLEKLKNDCVDIEMLTPRKQSDTDSERLSPSEGERESELETVTPLDSIENSPLTSPQHIAKTGSSHLELTNLDTDLDLLPTKEVPTKPQHTEQSDTFQYPATKMFGMSPSDKFSHGSDHDIGNIKDILLANEAKPISQGIDSQYDKIRADVEHQHVGDTGGVEDKCLVDLSDQELTVSAQRSDYSEVNGVLQNTEDVKTAVDISGDITDNPQCVHVYNQDKLDDTVDDDDVNKADDVDDNDQELRNTSATDRGFADSDGDIDEVDNEELDGFLNEDDSEASEKVGLLIESVTKKMCNISHQDSKERETDSKERETDTCSNDREKDRETRGLDSRGRGKGRKVRREKERSRSGDSGTDIHPLLNSPGNTIDESINSVDEPHDVQC